MAARRKTSRARSVRASRSPAAEIPPPAPRTPKKEHRIRLSLHKNRCRWFQARAAWPYREAPVARLTQARRRARRATPLAPGASRWACVGPTNVGGRVTSIVCDPAHPDRIWIGAAGGGVWHSPDAGRTWTAQWHDQEVLNIGALAIHPSDSDVLFAGTGEGNLSADSYPGVGLFATGDGGVTWRMLASCEQAGLPRRIGAIAIDPFDPRHLLLGGVGYSTSAPDHDLGGMYESRDGGVTWVRKTFVGHGNYWCHSILFHPTRRGIAWTSVTVRGAASGLYKTLDGGRTWQQLTGGLPATETIGRTGLALAPSRPDVLYAVASNSAPDDADRLLGLFRSLDGGRRWTDVSNPTMRREGQMSYNNTIAVHPSDPKDVLWGGVDLFQTRDGGGEWARVTRWDFARGHARYAHSDHHALLRPERAPDRVYDCNDGGLDVSEDRGRRWTNRSSGLAITMFYDLDVSQSDARLFGGGAQDNGTNLTADGRVDSFAEISGGDGGWVVIDPRNPGHIFASSQYFCIDRIRDGRRTDASPRASDDEATSVWMSFLVMHPNDSRTLLVGSTRVWRTQDDGDTWHPLSPHFDDSPITCVEFAAARPRRIYVGTENGGIFCSDDSGASWSANLAGSEIPGYTVTRIATSPSSANVVYATIANYGHSHVYRSRDGGRSWEDADRGALPDVPHHCVLVAGGAPDVLFVGNEIGVYGSPDGGRTWRDLSRNLPSVQVVDLVHHKRERTLSAATYGRSIWRLALG